MSPVDISGMQLRDLSPDERVDYTQGYEVGGEFQVPPPPGAYLVQTLSVKPARNPNKEGFLSVDVEAVLVQNHDGTSPATPQMGGYKIYQSSLSTKRYRNRNGSPVEDYLRAHGIRFTTTPTNDEYAQALNLTEGKFAPIRGDWEGYCRDCDANLEGYDAFPFLVDPGTNQLVEDEKGGKRRNYRGICLHCKKEVLARLRVQRWVSTVATP